MGYKVERAWLKVPEKLVDAFELCDAITFPNIHVLLQHFLSAKGVSAN